MIVYLFFYHVASALGGSENSVSLVQRKLLNSDNSSVNNSTGEFIGTEVMSCIVPTYAQSSVCLCSLYQRNITLCYSHFLQVFKL